jgi:hypothetical protein
MRKLNIDTPPTLIEADSWFIQSACALMSPPTSGGCSVPKGRVEEKYYYFSPPIRNRACDFHRTRLLNVLPFVTIGLLNRSTLDDRNIVNPLPFKFAPLLS